MQKLLANNRFCAVLIIIFNAGVIASLTILTKTTAEGSITAFLILYSVLLLGNILIRHVMKDDSKELARYYLFIIFFFVLIFYPLVKFTF